MPLAIIRNDITKVKADAIVNTANPEPVYASGTDRAIYEAAGAQKLLKERKKIGVIQAGEAAVTDAFDLPARFIIHTVGPSWKGGNHHEFDVLTSCYNNSLQKAYDLGCDSVAFPLIATGVYGFPKDIALNIAVTCISSFLVHHEMHVILVVFDRSSYQLSTRFMEHVQSLIDEEEVEKVSDFEYSHAPARAFRSFSNIIEPSVCYETSVSLQDELSSMMKQESLEDRKTFQEKMFEIMEEKGFVSTDVYKAANMDRKLFSKIQCNKDYHPKKKTAMAICIALHLNIEQAKDLLARADWAFSPNRLQDRIVMAALQCGEYDIMTINEVLFAYDTDLLV